MRRSCPDITGPWFSSVTAGWTGIMYSRRISGMVSCTDAAASPRLAQTRQALTKISLPSRAEGS